jgi:hypothetical protein
MSNDEYSEVRSAVIRAGYLQQDSNDEGMVDLGTL